jgi:protein gp37
MAETTAIEWTDATWSPWEGCQKVGPGCDHCYAEGMNRWLRKGVNWGPGAPRRTYSDEHWAKPLRWNASAQALIEVLGPGERKKVFPSVCDPFDNAAPPGERERFGRLILATPHLTWLLLTKRIGNASAMLAGMFPEGQPDNVWLGATVVNQEEADRDIPKLLAVPARVRFLSIEPMLGPIYLRSLPMGPLTAQSIGLSPRSGDHFDPLHPRLPRGRIDWVIAGGESGPGARPMHPGWARSLREQCAAAGVPFLFKQWGEWSPGYAEHGNDLGYEAIVAARQHEWPEGHCSFHVGKKTAGRHLDGRTHDEFPRSGA